MAPSKPASLSYGELNWALSAHLKPKPLIIAETFRFHRRNQAEGEGVSQYLAELRRLADRCKFSNHLEEALWDRLVCGTCIRNEHIQCRLLTLEDLTVAKAYEMAQGMETAEQHASELQASTKPNGTEA